MIKKYLYIGSLLSASFLYGFSDFGTVGVYESNNEEKQYEEKFELVSTNPFVEGQVLSQSDETYTQNELDNIEELTLISMYEFDMASDEEERKEKQIKVLPAAKVMEQASPNIESKTVQAVAIENQSVINEQITQQSTQNLKVFPSAVVMQQSSALEQVVKVKEKKEQKTEQTIIKPQIQIAKKPEIKKAMPGELEAKLALDEELQITRLKPQEVNAAKIKEEPKIEPKVQIIKQKETIKPSISKQTSIDDISDYEQIIIEVDSITNNMKVKARVNNEYIDLKTYKVSTGKKSITIPQGIGSISKISLNPIWYPTESTKRSFKKKGINLPNVVPPGHKFNYMGAAKINLTHTVNGKNTYRIHGTLNEKTLGRNESAGCIRMKNNEVVQLSTLLNKFASLKSMNDIKVVLK